MSNRPTIVVIQKQTGLKYLVNYDHYLKYRENYEVVQEESNEPPSITDEDILSAYEMEDYKELRDFLRSKGITFRGKKTKEQMIKLLEDSK